MGPGNAVAIFKKVGYSRPLFIYFSLFNAVYSKKIFDINFADDWSRTLDLWYRKRPLYQLSHNHFPQLPFLLFFLILLNEPLNFFVWIDSNVNLLHFISFLSMCFYQIRPNGSSLSNYLLKTSWVF